MDKLISPKNKNAVIIVLTIALAVSIAIAVYYYKKAPSLIESVEVEEQFKQLPTAIKQTDKPTLVLFWAKWCPNCTNMKEEWEKTVSILTKEGVISVLDFESERDKDEIMSAVNKYKGMGYPHIRFFPKGYGGDTPSIQFEGPRTVQSFVTFAHKNLDSDEDKEISQTPI